MGIAVGAVRRVVEFAINELHLIEINAGMEAGNIPSHKAFERAGFTRIEDKSAARQYRWSKAAE